MTHVVVEADGGSRGNPGVAGYGALVRDTRSGALLAERAAPLGKASNNVAEYTGLIEGLRAASELSPGCDVEVRMDSKLVVEQMSGRWKIKHTDMRRLAEQAREIVSQIRADGGSVSFTWIPRERNKAADALSNKGMDGETVHRDLTGDGDGPTEASDGSGDGGVQDAVATEGLDADPADTATDETDRAEGRGDRAAAAAAATSVRTSGSGGSGTPDLGAPTRVVIVRHGATEYNSAGRITGRGGDDPALSSEGTHQARRAATAIAAAVGEGDVEVVSSGLTRARQTAAVIASALGVEPSVDRGWDEQDLGEWEGLTWAEIGRRDPGAPARARSDEDFAAPGGEPFSAVAARVEQAWEAVAHGDRAVVVVTHRGPIDALLGRLLGVPRGTAARVAATPGSLMWLRVWADRGFMIDRVNDDAHLR